MGHTIGQVHKINNFPVLFCLSISQVWGVVSLEKVGGGGGGGGGGPMALPAQFLPPMCMHVFTIETCNCAIAMPACNHWGEPKASPILIEIFLCLYLCFCLHVLLNFGKL